MSKKPLEIDMIAGSQLRDTQGEMLSVEGADITELLAGNGRLNDNHGKGFFNSIGRVTEAKKIMKSEDCENDRHKHYWEKVKCPFVYVKGILYDDEDHPNARAAAAILRNIHKADAPLQLKASVEGGVIARGIKDPSLLARTKIHSVALTFTPANNATLVEPLNLEKSANIEADEMLIKSVMHLAKTDVPSFRHIARRASAEKIIDNLTKAQELATAAGLESELVIPEPQELIQQALEFRIAENINKINELTKTLIKARPNPSEFGYYQIGEEGKESEYTGKDAKKAQINVVKYVARQPHSPYKNMMNEETGKPELHVMMHRGISKEGFDPNSSGRNKLKIDDTHVQMSNNSVHTLHPDVAHEYSGNDGHVFSFWVPVSKINALAEYHHAGFKNPKITIPKEDLENAGMNEQEYRDHFINEPHSHSQAHVSIKPGKYQRVTEDEMKSMDQLSEARQPRRTGEHTLFHYSTGGKNHDSLIPIPHNFPKLNKALTVGYGGAGAPTSRTGGSVMQAESLEDGRKGFRYITCDSCGDEQVYMKHQVKCRKCNQSFPFAKVAKVMISQ